MNAAIRAAAEVKHVRLGPSCVVPGTRYQIVRWLGEGAMGVVYEGRHIDVQRPVALKILRPEYSRSSDEIAGFRSEARATSNIGSENIVQVYDFAELPDGRVMIAMELLQGHDLRSELTAPFEFERVIGILRQLCRGLRAAHAAGIIHRDIKPENIFVLTNGERRDKIKIVDFGVASVAIDGATCVAGTPPYLAPESISSGIIQPTVDQYAVGCVAYELVTGRVPFEERELEALLTAHVEATPEPPSRLRQSVPPALERVILRCLEKKPEDRFADMADVEAALCEAQIEANLSTHWDDLPLPDVEATRRDRLLRGMPDPHEVAVHGTSWSILAALALGLMVIASVATYFAVRESPAPAANEVDALVMQAHAAAANALFVYPPADDPTMPTAYAIVRKLERRVRDPVATTRAAALRAELSRTLVRLGDELWEHPSGRPFASGYYEQALLFDPEIAVARERAETSDDALSRLGVRATEQSFSDDELVAIEPYIVLATPDDGRRGERLDAWRSRRAEDAKRRQREVDALVGRNATQRAPASTEPTIPQTAPASVPASTPAAAPAVAAATAAARPTSTPTEAASDGAAARPLAARGRAALRAGRTDEARGLFERALARDSRSLAALVGLRDIHFDAADYGRAAHYGEQVVRVSSNRAEHHIRLGDAYYKILRHGDAERAYEKAVALGDSRAVWRLEKLRKLTK